jgi:molybdenum-dependent DNA-binding transcriptional regulator ModE
MRKEKAIERLGGSVAEAARTLGLTYQAVAKWPDNLSQSLSDRIEGFLARREREAAKAAARADNGKRRRSTDKQARA